MKRRTAAQLATHPPVTTATDPDALAHPHFLLSEQLMPTMDVTSDTRHARARHANNAIDVGLDILTVSSFFFCPRPS